jgi:quinate dehydrogenase
VIGAVSEGPWVLRKALHRRQTFTKPCECNSASPLVERFQFLLIKLGTAARNKRVYRIPLSRPAATTRRDQDLHVDLLSYPVTAPGLSIHNPDLPVVLSSSSSTMSTIPRPTTPPPPTPTPPPPPPHTHQSPRQRSAFLFGTPIAHALGPTVHTTIWRHLSPDPPNNIDYRFDLLDSTDTAECLRWLRDRDGCVGCSITMPNKVAMVKSGLLDGLAEEARVVGGVNTVFFRDSGDSSEDAAVATQNGAGGSGSTRRRRRRRLIGANTDTLGIRDAFLRVYPTLKQNLHERGPNCHSALVLGAGGAARAAVYALWKLLGVQTIFIVNRDADEARGMIESLVGGGVKAELVFLDGGVEGVDAAITTGSVGEGFGMVVGTVPDVEVVSEGEKRAWGIVEAVLSTRSSSGDDDERTQAGIRCVLDMAYTPSPRTRLLRLAEGCGWTTISGVDVLADICIAQNRLWCPELWRREWEGGVEGVDEVVRQKLREILAERG